MSRSAYSHAESTEQLTQHDQLVLRTLSLHRLMDGSQLRRLFFHSSNKKEAGSRLMRLHLVKLETLGLTARLERRVGGVRAGSAGTIWQLDAHGQRVLAYLDGQGFGRPRQVYEPGAAYVAHTLACSEVFVRLNDAERAGQLELVDYQAEPTCWRQFMGDLGQPLTLKPDGFVAAVVGEFEERVFVEVDLASHGRAALRRKLRLYVDYQRSGIEQAESPVFPRVIWIVPSLARQHVLAGLISELPDDAAQAHGAVIFDDFIDVLRRKNVSEQMNGGEK